MNSDASTTPTATLAAARALLDTASETASRPAFSRLVAGFQQWARSEASAPAVPYPRAVLVFLPAPEPAATVLNLLHATRAASDALRDHGVRTTEPGRDQRALHLLHQGVLLTRHEHFASIVAEFQMVAHVPGQHLARVPSSILPLLAPFLQMALDAADREPHGQRSLFDV